MYPVNGRGISERTRAGCCNGPVPSRVRRQSRKSGCCYGLHYLHEKSISANRCTCCCGSRRRSVVRRRVSGGSSDKFGRSRSFEGGGGLDRRSWEAPLTASTFVPADPAF